MRDAFNKVPQVTLAFWVIKICATTLGETGGDAVSMTLKLGYAAGTAIFFGVFLVTLIAQIAAKRYNPLFYWMVILSTTTAGTTMSDYLDRTAHFGYIGGSLVLIAILVSVLTAWRLALGSISFDHVADPKVEAFYWITILFSNTLGTALGDFLADDAGLGYQGGALVIGAALAAIAAAYFFTRVLAHRLVLASFRTDAPAGRHLGRHLDQDPRQGRHGPWNPTLFADACPGDDRSGPGRGAKAGAERSRGLSALAEPLARPHRLRYPWPGAAASRARRERR